MPHRDRAIILAFAVVLMVLAGAIMLPVARPAPIAAVPTPSPSPTEDVVAFRDGVVGRPSSLTPLTQRTRADRDIVALVFRGLVGLGPGQTLVPDLAESWTIADAGKTYTFAIRPDAQWDDGTPVTADDVVFTVGMLKDEGYTGPTGASWTDVTAEAVDAKTVKFSLGKPIGGFVELARQPLLPSHLLADVKAADLADSPFAQSPVGNGPYRIVSRDADHAILEPSDGYAGPVDPGGTADATPSPTPGASTAPGASSAAASAEASAAPTPPRPRPRAWTPPRCPVRTCRSTWRPPASRASRCASSTTRRPSPRPTGRARSTRPRAWLPPPRPGLMDVAGTRLVRYPSAIFTSLTFNLRPDHARFGDLHFRRAIEMAIDRTKIVDDAYLGLAALAETPIPPTSWAFSAAESRPLPFDRKKATAELKKAGWKKTAKGWVAPKTTKPFALKVLALDAASNPVSNAVAQAVAKDLTTFGIKTTVTSLPPAELITKIQDGDFDAVLLDANIGLDPDLYPLLASTQAGHGGSNVSGVQNADLDKLLEAARKPGTTAARKQRYAALQDFLSTEQTMPPLVFRDYIVAYRSTLDGPVARELGDLSDQFWDVLTWRLAANPVSLLRVGGGSSPRWRNW